MVQGILARRPDITLSVSYTTRRPRPMERNGEHYHFISEREFTARRERGEFLEWAEVYDNFYGTSRSWAEEALARGQEVLLEIDVQGALQVKRVMPEAALIFIEPPSFQVLEQRLRKRSTEREDEIARRRAAAYDIMRSKHWFDGVFVNEDIDETVDKVLQLMDRLKE